MGKVAQAVLTNWTFSLIFSFIWHQVRLPQNNLTYIVISGFSHMPSCRESEDWKQNFYNIEKKIQEKSSSWC